MRSFARVGQDLATAAGKLSGRMIIALKGAPLQGVAPPIVVAGRLIAPAGGGRGPLRKPS